MRLKDSALMVASLAAALASQLSAGVVSAQENPPPAAPAATTAGPAQPAAEATPAPKRQAEETILVTGSRIRRSKEVSTPAPVTVIGREQIQSSAAVSVGDFLQMLPEQGGGTNTNVNNGGDGETQISLRQLGSVRTLVLIDGKRMVSGGIGPGNGIDLNTIPTALIEKIEVLKDGASTLYGSDAIAGVVNIITRKRMEGVEASAYRSISGHNDAGVYDLNVQAGAQSDKASFMVGAGYFVQDEFFASARSWGTYALGYDFLTGKVDHSGSPTTPNVRVSGLNPANCPTQLCQDLAAAQQPGGLFEANPGRQNWIYMGQGAPGTVDGWRIRDPKKDVYNYQAVNYLLTPSNRASFYGNGEYRFSDNARVYVQTHYVNRRADTQVAPEPFSTVGAGVTVSGQNPYNPFGTNIASLNLRLEDLPGRGDLQTTDTFRIVTGLDGTLPEAAGPLQGWFWDLSYNYGKTSGTDTNRGWLNTQTAAPGLGPGTVTNGVYSCGTAGNEIAGCTPINLFGGKGGINSDMAKQLGLYSGTDTGMSQMYEAQANVSGDLMKLGSDRPVALAAGFAYRDETGFYQYEPIAAAGWNADIGMEAAPKNTSGSFSVYEGYGELSIPLVDKMTGIEDLEFDAAIRAFKYSSFGGDYTYKLGLKYMPIRDVTLRGTYSTGFRAPSITDLYLGVRGGNYEYASDPCANVPAGNQALLDACGPAANNGVQQSQLNSSNGGNPDLKPEKANIMTFGAVFEPSFVPNLAFTIDYYRIKLTDAIGSYGSALIVNKCYGVGQARETKYCDLIKRNPTTQEISSVFDRNENVGQYDTDGIDFGLSYAMPTEFGRFGVRADATYLITWDYTQNDVTIKSAGNYDSTGSTSSAGNLNPKWKANMAINYGIENFSAALNGRFIQGFDECAQDGGYVSSSYGYGFCYTNSGPNGGDTGKYQVLYPKHRVDNYFAFDLVLGYKLDTSAGTTGFQFGISNLTDVKPPVVYDSSLTYADPAYNFVGRAFYGRISHKF